MRSSSALCHFFDSKESSKKKPAMPASQISQKT